MGRKSESPIINWICQPVRADVVLPASAGGVDTRAKECARVAVEREAARAWRVTLGPLDLSRTVVNPDSILTPGLSPISARIQWGFDGVTETVDVDWPLRGGHVDLWGSEVNVQMIVPGAYRDDPLEPVADPQAQINGKATIVPAVSVGGPRVTRSIYTGTITEGMFSDPIPIPPFARSVRFHQLVSSSGGPPIPLEIGVSQDAAANYPVQSYPSGVLTTDESTWPTDDGLTLSPLGRFLFVGNGSPVGPPFVQLSVWCEFVLDLG